jgi:methylphosphotriester-DNA--protein-cysteine methyltransferase
VAGSSQNTEYYKKFFGAFFMQEVAATEDQRRPAKRCKVNQSKSIISKSQ